MSLQQFPEINLDKEPLNIVKLIDVLWFHKRTNNVIAAFEVEKSTSIYSGILRLTDLKDFYRYIKSDVRPGGLSN